MVEERKKFIERVNGSGESFSAICLEFRISRKTGYKWLNRYTCGGSLEGGRRRPHCSPAQTAEYIEDKIIELRLAHPAWGARKLHAVLSKKNELPSIKTVNNILKRNGLISKEEAFKHTAYKRFERSGSNELWQADFKGNFLLSDGTMCYPLDVLDDHSRFAVNVEPKTNTLGVKDSFERIFKEKGQPKQLLMDNGWCFRGLHNSFTSLERWLMEHDIHPIHGRVRHPQTQGKIERFHRTMEAELLSKRKFLNMEDFKEELNEWIREYNEERPHEGLGNKCPKEIYKPSEIVYNSKITDWEYGKMHTAKVNNWGYLRFQNHQTYLSEVFINTYLGIVVNEENNTLDIHFRNFQIAQIDITTGELLNRRITIPNYFTG